MRWMRYLLVSMGVTVLLISPILYPRLRERMRLGKVERIKKESVKREGMSFQEFKSLIETGDFSLPILYTGDTRGYLETCGCFAGQAGGMARRAALIGYARSMLPTLLLDAGGIAEEVEDELDKLRVEEYLKLMAQLGYDAVCPSRDEFPILSRSPLNLVSANIEGATPFLVKELGGIRVGITGLSEGEPIKQLPLGDLRGKADVIILLTNLPAERVEEALGETRGVDYVISSRRGELGEVKGAKLLFSAPKGEGIGFIAIRKGSLEGITGQVVLDDEVPEDGKVRDEIDGFYREVIGKMRLRTARKPLPGGNRYIGSEECRSCHQEEYESWVQTPHATAFNALLRRNRHFHPDCLRCHTTGYGYESGYEVGVEGNEKLEGVGCESCHGPGRKHLLNPMKENIEGKVGESVCMSCHDEEHSPGFDKLIKFVRSEVDHSRKSLSFEELIAQHTRGTL
ncbi:hypothetical protein DRP77_11305, partial [Candidatus Poribacteria bacterium]